MSYDYTNAILNQYYLHDNFDALRELCLWILIPNLTSRNQLIIKYFGSLLLQNNVYCPSDFPVLNSLFYIDEKIL